MFLSRSSSSSELLIRSPLSTGTSNGYEAHEWRARHSTVGSGAWPAGSAISVGQRKRYERELRPSTTALGDLCPTTAKTSTAFLKRRKDLRKTRVSWLTCYRAMFPQKP